MYIIEIINESGADYEIDCPDEDDLKKMLRNDILDYTDCDDIGCIIQIDVDEIVANVNILGEYSIIGCHLTPEIIIYKC